MTGLIHDLGLDFDFMVIAIDRGRRAICGAAELELSG
jgi:hypothetical protein